MTGQPHYPYRDGDFAILGPEVFASADGMTISWQGARYRRDYGPDPERRGQLDAALAALGKSEIELADVRRRAEQAEAALREVLYVAEVIDANGINWAADSIRRAAALDQPPAHNAGPSVRECAEVDRRWPLQKNGE